MLPTRGVVLAAFRCGRTGTSTTLAKPMLEVAVLSTETGDAYQARLRLGTPMDRIALVASWGPTLERGPVHWQDREWPWRTFGATDLHLDVKPQWLVLADEVEPTARGELFGVLVTTGPSTANQAGISDLLEMDSELIWVEYIAIAPSLRPDCPAPYRRKPRVKGIGPRLMRAAIARSEALGLSGRIGLHAEGDGARETYKTKWGMRDLGEAVHRAGGAYPVCFGDAAWAAQFCSELGAGRR